VHRPGPANLITDVPGILVGHATDERARTGVTTLLCGTSWIAGVDVRGGGPGVRETEALAPENLLGRVHALVLAGGSVFGLAAADGVAAALSDRGVGLQLRPGAPAIPIVPAAVLHDLGNDGDKAWGLEPPYRSLGIAALDAARADFRLGSVGAGRGAASSVRANRRKVAWTRATPLRMNRACNCLGGCRAAPTPRSASWRATPR
jgi:L-aminopeptidase/D-esterase-like protein